MNYSDFFEEIAIGNYCRFCGMTHAVSGHNGPYIYEDTPVRNTGHWAIVYAYLWKITHDQKYKDLSISFGDYLVQEQKKSANGAIQCMTGDRYDKLNGLIGQAWVIETLIYLYKCYGIEDYYNCSVEIFNSQKFEMEKGLWRRIEIDGSDLGFDVTLNHQVWFALSGLMINECINNVDIMVQVSRFLEKLNDEYFDVYPNGLIKHYIKDIHQENISYLGRVKRQIKQLLLPLKRKNPNKYDKYALEKGYHLFELYGYAILHSYQPRCALFKNGKFKKSLKYIDSVKSIEKVFNIKYLVENRNDSINKFSFGYNCPTFEYPYILKELYGISDECVLDDLLDLHKKTVYDISKYIFDRNNYDAETLTSRIYEMVRFIEKERTLDGNQ